MSGRNEDLTAVFLSCWAGEGYSAEDLPETWREQLAVWKNEGVTAQDIRSYFAAWARKPRLGGADELYRYVQVCCFNKRHTRSAPRSRRRSGTDDGWERSTDWGEPSWMGRDPGIDGGW